MYSVYIYVCVCVVMYDICVSLCGLFDVDALGCYVFLMHSKSCGEAHFGSLSFSQMAFKRELLNLCDGKMYSVHKH